MRIIAVIITLMLVSLLQGQVGTLDQAFGMGGKVLSDPTSSTENIIQLLVRPLSGFYAVGRKGQAEGIVVGAYWNDGSVDADHGVEGFWVSDLGLDSCTPTAAVVDEIGRVLITGNYIQAGQEGIFLIRLMEGQLFDPSFNGGEVLLIESGVEVHRAHAMIVQDDGMIVIAGEHGYMAMARRYHSDGGPDTDFGSDGLALIPTGLNIANAITLDANGNILIAGDGTGPNSNVALGVARLTGSGQQDPQFQNGYSFQLPFSSRGASITCRSDGKILIAGTGYVGLSINGLVVQLTNDGDLDQSFNGIGHNGSDLTSPPVVFVLADRLYDLVLQENGKVLGVGYAGEPSGQSFVIARYEEHGPLDQTWGTSGRVLTSFTPAPDEASTVLITDDGKLLVGGSAGWPQQQFAIAQYHLDITTALGEVRSPGVELFPNPTIDHVRIKGISSMNEHLILELKNSIGQTVKRIVISSADEQIALNGLASGVYMYSLRDVHFRSVALGKLVVTSP